MATKVQKKQPTQKTKTPKKKKKSPLVRFFSIVFTIVFVFLVVAGGVVLGYYKSQESITSHNDNTPREGITYESPKSKNLFETIFLAPKNVKTNVAVFGVDNAGSLTDVIFIVNFNSKTNQINLFSIPRDTRVKLTDDLIADLKSNNRPIPAGGVCKINEVHSYAGKEIANEASVKMLENMLDIKIDSYVKIDLEGFEKVIDAVDGLDFYVPRNMYHYDPDQDLLIDLKKGQQHLTGEKALHLVRFRGYNEGDVGRVEMQHMFLEELAKKILNTETIMNNLKDLATIFFQHVETNVNLADGLQYVKYAQDLSLDNITMATLPGEGQYINGVSYFIIDENEKVNLVNQLFNYSDTVTPKKEVVVANSKDKKIEIANGGRIQGLAGQKKEMLVKNGFDAAKITISTYVGAKANETRIFVKNKEDGQDLIQYFENAALTVDSSEIATGKDIIIILGTDEKAH